MSELPRTNDRAYDLRQRLDRAVRWLREAEDTARVEMPAWPTADRIRSIYEQVTADVLEGRKNAPPLLAQLAEREAAVERVILEAQAVRDEYRDAAVLSAPHERLTAALAALQVE